MRSESQREQLAGPQCVATLVGCLLAFLPALAGSVLAQEPNAGELVNYPFFYGSGSDSGLGAYAVGDRTVQMLTIRPRPMLRSPWKHSWGLRLRLTATLGYYDFEDLEQTIASFRTVAFVPGVEVLFPLSSSSLLYPYIDLGVGSNESRTGLRHAPASQALVRSPTAPGLRLPLWRRAQQLPDHHHGRSGDTTPTAVER